MLKTSGFLGGKELVYAKLTFWTLTIWKNDANMKTFLNSAAHRTAMKKTAILVQRGFLFSLDAGNECLPSLKKVSEKLLKYGKLTKVRNPSANQISNSFPPVKWSKLQRNFKRII